MELLFYFLLSFLFLFLFLLLIQLRSFTHSYSKSKLPPGPWKLPIIGSMHHLFGSLPHHAMRNLSKIYGPIMHLKLGEISTIVISSPEAAKEIMKTRDITFATRPTTPTMDILSYGGKSITFGPYSEHWRQLRKMCMLELLSTRRVNSFQSIREEEVDNLIQSIFSSNGSIINLSEKLKSLANNIVMRAAIGNMCKDQSTYLSALNDAVQLATSFNLADLYPSWSWLLGKITGSNLKTERCRHKIDMIIDGIIREHRKQKTTQGNGNKEDQAEEDFVDVLLRIQADNALQFQSDDCIRAVISDMIGAGSETSSTVLEWAMSELMRNPIVMKRVQSEVREALKGKAKITEMHIRELNYLHLVIKETLRLHAPVPLLLPRMCRETCEVLGYEIPEKSRVLVNVWAMGRDPQYWKHVEEFKPERFEGSSIDFKGVNFEFLPFGAGRRICPGMSFGLANVEFPLALLLYYFDWELPGGTGPNDLDMDDSVGVTARRRTDLSLCAITSVPYHGTTVGGESLFRS